MNSINASILTAKRSWAKGFAARLSGHVRSNQSSSETDSIIRFTGRILVDLEHDNIVDLLYVEDRCKLR